MNEKQAAAKLAADLSQGFAWAHTPQGARYWEVVYRNLCKIAEIECDLYAGRDEEEPYSRSDPDRERFNCNQ